MIGFVLLWVGITVAGLVAIGSVLFALTDKRLKIVSSSVSERRRWNTALTAVLTVCGIFVTAASILLVSGTVKAGSGHESEQEASASNPPPPSIVVQVPAAPPGDVATVTCPQTVSGTVTGKIPSGDVLVIGYRASDSSIWTFPSQVNVTNGSWSSTIYVGHRGDTGKDFALVYFLMPATWAGYLINSFDQAAPSATWWDATTLPPFITHPYYQTVSRSTPGPSCSQLLRSRRRLLMPLSPGRSHGDGRTHCGRGCRNGIGSVRGRCCSPPGGLCILT